MFFKWLESNFNAMYSAMSPQDRWGGPNADLTKRLVAADAHEEEHGNSEMADRLRDPNAHLVDMPGGHLRHSTFDYDAFNGPYRNFKEYLEIVYNINIHLWFWLHHKEELKATPQEEKELPYGQVSIVFDYQAIYSYEDSPPAMIRAVPASRRRFSIITTYDKVGQALVDQLLREAREEGAEVDTNDPEFKKLTFTLVNRGYEKESPMERLKDFLKKRNVERAKLGQSELKLKNTRFDAPSE